MSAVVNWARAVEVKNSKTASEKTDGIERRESIRPHWPRRLIAVFF
jgi:hypothetical protein